MLLEVPHGVACRVLMVDDEVAVLEAARDYLGIRGLRVDTAQEREEAEALLVRVDYALVILDMRLTGVHGREGLELLRFVREHRPLARVVVITAHGSAELEREVRRRGADAFVEKPVALGRLAEMAFGLLTRRPPLLEMRHG